jgi:hypothetical protein
VHWRRIGTVDERGNGFCFLGEAIAPLRTWTRLHAGDGGILWADGRAGGDDGNLRLHAQKMGAVEHADLFVAHDAYVCVYARRISADAISIERFQSRQGEGRAAGF